MVEVKKWVGLGEMGESGLGVFDGMDGGKKSKMRREAKRKRQKGKGKKSGREVEGKVHPREPTPWEERSC